MKSGQEHLSVAQALYQLDFYLQQLDLPFCVKDLYREAYATRRGDAYKDDWLDVLVEDPAVAGCLHSPFTTHSIAETVLRTGHEQLVRVLIRKIQQEEIGFTQAYIVGMGRHKR